MNKFYEKGITVVEILIVVAIFGILFAVVLPQFSSIKENQVLKNAVEDTLSVLHNAQSQSLASVNSSEYGVHFQSDRVILFAGQVFSAGAVDNKTTDIILPASISNVTLGGISATSGNIYFERLSGVPNETGTITISTSSVSKTITISATGAISVN